MADAEVVAEVGVSLSKTSLDALSATIAKALDKGLKNFSAQLSKAIGKDLNKVYRDVAASAKKFADQLDRVGTGARSLRGLTTGMKATDKETLKLVRSMEALAQSQETIQRAIAKSQSDFLQQTKRQNQLTIESTRLRDRAGQEQIETARNVAKRDVVITQGAEQQKVVAARFAGQQRVQLTRAVIENVARLERGLAATVAGIARTTVSATGRMFDALTAGFRRVGQIGGSTSISSSNFTSSIKRMNSEMNRNVSSSLSTREKTIRASFLRQERFLSQSAARQQATLTRLRSQTSTGVLGAATGRGIGPGLGAVGAGVGLGALLTSGFQRFSEIERLNKQFLALTGNLEEATMLMAQVKEFAKLTPFDLVGVAGLAKGFLAIGTAADQVLPQVRAIADAVALTGGGTEQLDRIQRAIGQVVSTGKLQGDELNQLAESLPGLNIRKILAGQLTGGDVAKLVEMQAAGEISGEAFVDGLITGLQEDPRLVGASEDLAKTLGGIAANTKEAFADLGASIIGLFSGQIKVAFKGAQVLMQSLSDFIKGENLSAGLDTLRTALGGVAAGLATIGAAKAALEVFALLARTIPLLLTPFGLLATAAGLLGGAFALMLEKSVPFRIALRNLGERFGDVAERIKDFVGDKLAALADFIAGTLIPALIDLADWLGANVMGAVERLLTFIDDSVIPTLSRWAGVVVRDLIGAYHLAASFISATVIPRLREFVGFMRSSVFPVVADVARAIAGRFMDALGAVQRFGQRIRPYIQPVIDGFERLGRALGRALTGDFSTIGTGAMGALSGIGSTIVNLWNLAFEALRPIATRFLDWLGSVFTVSNLKKAFSAVLDAFEWVGEQLGKILSSPTFLTAVAGVAGAAGLLAIRFIKGFIEGIISNIPELAGLLGDALGALFRAAFTAENIFKGIGIGLLFAAVLRPLIASFRSAGSAAAGAFRGGLSGVFGSGGVGGITQGLFTGPNATLTSNALGDMKMLNREAPVLQNRFAMLGKEQVVNTGNLRQARLDMKRLEQSFTPAQLRALEFRDRVGAAFRAIGTTITGAGGVLSGILQLGKALAAPVLRGIGNVIAGAGMGVGNIIGSILMPKDFTAATNAGRQTGEKFGAAWARGIGTIRDSWTNMMKDLRAAAESQGVSIGRAFGQALAAGAALSLAGFVAGRAEGQSGGSGLLSALGIGLTGAALGSPILGAAAAGVALIGSAIGRSSKEAKDARERIEGYANAIAHDLTPAVEAAGPFLASFNDLLAGGDKSEFLAALRSQLEDVTPALNDFGLTTAAVAEAFQSGQGAVTELLDRLRSRIGPRPEATAGWVELTNWTDRAAGIEPVIKAIERAWGEAGGALDLYNQKQRDLKLGEVIPGGIPTTGMMPKGVFDGPPGTGIFGDPKAFPTTMAGMWTDARNFFNEQAAAARRQQADRKQAIEVRGLGSAKEESEAFYRNLMKANAAWDDFGNKPKPKTLEQAQQDAEDLLTKYVQINAAIDTALRPRGTSGLTEMIDQAVLSVRDSFDGLKIGGDIFDKAALNVAIAGFGDTLSGVIQTAVNEGVVPNAANLQFLTSGILDALLATTEDEGVKQQIRDYYNDAVREGAIAAFVSQGVPEEVLRAGSGIGKALVDGTIAGVEANFQRARNVAARLAAILTGTLKINTGISSPSKVFMRIGEQLGQGLVIGIERTTAAVRSAARSIAESATITPPEVGVASPDFTMPDLVSLVMPAPELILPNLLPPDVEVPSPRFVMPAIERLSLKIPAPAIEFARSLVDVGRSAIEGLATSIEAAAPRVETAVTRVLDDVMKRLNQPTLGQSLFGRVIGSMAPTGPGGTTSTDFSAAVSKFASGVGGMPRIGDKGDAQDAFKLGLKAWREMLLTEASAAKQSAGASASPEDLAWKLWHDMESVGSFIPKRGGVAGETGPDSNRMTGDWQAWSNQIESAIAEAVGGFGLSANPEALKKLVFDNFIRPVSHFLQDPTAMGEAIKYANAAVDAVADSYWTHTANNPHWEMKADAVGRQLINGVIKGVDAAKPAALTATKSLAASVSSGFKLSLAHEDMRLAGSKITDGLAKGITGGTPTVTAATKAMVHNVIDVSRFSLGISSPSTVFMEIGRFIGEGLEIGIEDSTATIGDKMASAVRSAIDSAVNAAKAGTETLRTAASSLFGALTGSKSVFSGGAMVDQISGWTRAIQSFMEASTSTASKAFAVALKKFEGEALTPGESNIFGESAFSLNIIDVLGAENVDALKGVVDQIVSFGSEMLDAGVPVGLVVDKVKEWRDELLYTSGVLGFNVGDVRTLVNALGLSDTALVNFVTGLGDVTAAVDAATAAAKAAALAASMPGGTSNTTPGGAVLGDQARYDAMVREALTLSPKDLEVFARVNDLDRDFIQHILTLQADVRDDSPRELEDLGRILGLWGSALEDFVDRLGDFIDAPDADKVTHLPRPDISVTIYPPYGDPLAIGLGAVNAVALAAQIPGG